MARRTLYLPALIVAAVLMACAGALLLAVSSEGEATSPGKNGRIAYASGDPSDQSEPYFGPIYTITPGGGGRSKVATGGPPSYSPDGKGLVFSDLDKTSSKHPGDYEIYTVDARGGIGPN